MASFCLPAASSRAASTAAAISVCFANSSALYMASNDAASASALSAAVFSSSNRLSMMRSLSAINASLAAASLAASLNLASMASMAAVRSVRSVAAVIALAAILADKSIAAQSDPSVVIRISTTLVFSTVASPWICPLPINSGTVPSYFSVIPASTSTSSGATAAASPRSSISSMLAATLSNETACGSSSFGPQEIAMLSTRTAAISQSVRTS